MPKDAPKGKVARLMGQAAMSREGVGGFVQTYWSIRSRRRYYMPEDVSNVARLVGLAVVSREIRENLLTNPEELVSKPIIYGSEKFQLNEAEKSLICSVKGAATIEEFALELAHKQEEHLAVPPSRPQIFNL